MTPLAFFFYWIAAAGGLLCVGLVSILLFSFWLWLLGVRDHE